MDQAQQIADIKAKSTPFATIAMKQAQGGWIIQGQIQWNDNVTNGVVLAENGEAVATTAQQAAQMALNYATYGKFDAPTQQSLSFNTGTQQADAAALGGNALGGGTI